MSNLSRDELIEKLKSIELLCLDADGTLTDGGMILDDHGLAIRRFYAHDGTGIAMIRALGIKVALVTTSVSEIMKKRAEVLRLEACVTGSMDKGADIKTLAEKLGVSLENTVHMGDDVNDILGFKAVGIPIAVSNSAPVIFDYSCYVTQTAGGYGAVREICDLILLAKTGKLYGPPYVTDYIQ